MSHSTPPACEPNSTSALVEKSGVLVARKHHLLVRWSHWLNVPILLGLILSGISIYWASLNRAVRIDDDVAEALYSGNRRVPHTPNRRLPRSRTTTTELLPILVIFPDGISL
jgi:hypothetical protein